MKEYLNVIVSVIMGLLIPICWALIKNHFNCKEIPKMKDDIASLENKLTEGDKNFSLLKQQVETMDKKFDKMDCKLDSIITMLTK